MLDFYVNAIVRPPRAEYCDDNLLGPLFTIRGKQYVREDITIINARYTYFLVFESMNACS
jgi:hypothetical protein